MTAFGAAVVTGGGGEIGAAICRGLDQAGWPVEVVDRDAEAAARVAASLTGPSAGSHRADVTDADDVDRLVRRVVERHGGIGVLVCNAGVAGAVAPVESYPEDAFARVMRVNVHGTFLCLRAVLPVMRGQGGGAVVCIASTSGIRGRANLAGYVASKHAVIGLTKTAALECVGSGVRVNAVLPGPVQGRMIQAINTATRELSGTGEVARSVAAPYGDVGDVAAAVCHLVSPSARHITGASLVVDGGSTIA